MNAKSPQTGLDEYFAHASRQADMREFETRLERAFCADTPQRRIVDAAMLKLGDLRFEDERPANEARKFFGER